MGRSCSVDECHRLATKRGWCDMHYRRWKRHGDPLIIRKAANGFYSGCSVDGCEEPHHAKGLCARHDSRKRYHGDPTAGGPPRILGDREARFWSHIEIREPDQCWLWTASITPTGYGQFFDDRLVAAHRVAVELATGAQVSEDLDVDHLCHNRDASCLGGHGCIHRRCVNPAHLEAVTHLENVRRGKRFARTGPQ